MNQNLSLATLGALDMGAAELIVDKAIAEAVADMDDRGEDGKPRKVAIEVTLLRLDNGLIEAHVAAQAKMPARRTASTIAKMRRTGQKSELEFQEFSPDDPEQKTIDEFYKKPNTK